METLKNNSIVTYCSHFITLICAAKYLLSMEQELPRSTALLLGVSNDFLNKSQTIVSSFRKKPQAEAAEEVVVNLRDQKSLPGLDDTGLIMDHLKNESSSTFVRLDFDYFSLKLCYLIYCIKIWLVNK